jgi:hypothetical protein
MLHDPTPTKKMPFTLFEREGTRNWSMRYSLGGKQYKKSLSTADENEALSKAYEIWHEQSFRAKQGLSLDSRAFSEVAEEFIEMVAAQAERDERSKYHPIYWPGIIRRFPVGYFGKRGHRDNHDCGPGAVSGMAQDLLDLRTRCPDCRDPLRAGRWSDFHATGAPQTGSPEHDEGRVGYHP